ncbi:MAG: cytidylate kinase family protein [Nanoarchaeota archaeon]|nr:cytidylate kinase family protein [Nanoarchaeota archaeon]
MKITISGLPGSGKTTVARMISQKLEIPFISIGDLRGEIAKEKRLTIDELNEIGKKEDWVHKRADEKTIQLGKTDKSFVIEGWLAYHFIPNSFKVFLKVDEKSSARRIFIDQREDEKKCKTEKEVKEMLKKRVNTSDDQFYKYYGVRFLDKLNYNIIIDTTNLSPQEVVKIILSKIKNINNFKHKNFFFINKMYDIFSKKQIEKTQEKPKEIIEVDFREKNSLVPSELIKNSFSVEFKELKVADYIVKGIAIERKSAKDFFSSVFDKRIFSQLEELNQYDKKILIVEGKLEGEMKMHKNALRGLLLSIAIEYKVPIIFSKNEEDTAKYLTLLGKKQKHEKQINAMKKSLTKEEELIFIMESFPGIGPVKSKKLLEKLGSIKGIVNSSKEKLKTVLGKETKEFLEIINRRYKENE